MTGGSKPQTAATMPSLRQLAADIEAFQRRHLEACAKILGIHPDCLQMDFEIVRAGGQAYVVNGGTGRGFNYLTPQEAWEIDHPPVNALRWIKKRSLYR